MARRARPAPALVIWLLLAGSAMAQAVVEPDGTVACSFEGWSNDLDDSGQPVFEAPSRNALVIGRLPPPVSVGLDTLSVTVRVTGYRDGWFRIVEAGYSTEVQGVRVPRRPVLAASGWLPTAGVKSLIGSDVLKAAPSRAAGTVAALAGLRREAGGGQVGFGPDGVAVRRLIACRGNWVEVDTEFGIGWVERVCARQLSRCP